MSNPENEHIPLERRKEIGTMAAFFGTIRDVLLSPASFFARPVREPSLIPPLLFALALHVPFCIGSVATTVTRMLAHPEPEQPAFIIPVIVVVAPILGMLLYPVIAAVVAAVHWVLLSVVGMRGVGYTDILRAVFYLHPVSLVATLLSPVGVGLEVLAPNGSGVVSFAYALVALIYSVVALSKVGKIHFGRVIVAFMIPMSLCCCVPVGSFAVWQYMGGARHHGSPTATP